MKYTINAVAIGFLFIFLSCSTPKETTVASNQAVADDRSVGKIENEVLKLVNNYRETKGLQPLKMVDEIVVEAEKHSQNMSNRKVGFGHGGFDARYQRILQNVPRAGGGAENVAYGNISVKDIVKGWINSPSHRKNMEGYFNITGIGVARDKKGILYYTQIFINQTKK